MRAAFILLFCTIIGLAKSQLNAPPVENDDDIICPATDTPMSCKLKLEQCSPIGEALTPPGGLMKNLVACTNSSGITLGKEFYKNIGQTFVSNTPEKLLDLVSTDKNISVTLNSCFFNAAGLMDEKNNFNKTIAIIKLSKAPLEPKLIIPVLDALDSCLLPTDLTVNSFLSCLRKACVQVVSVPMSVSPWNSFGQMTNPFYQQFGQAKPYGAKFSGFGGVYENQFGPPAANFGGK